MIDWVDLVGEGVRIRRRGRKSIYLIISTRRGGSGSGGLGMVGGKRFGVQHKSRDMDTTVQREMR